MKQIFARKPYYWICMIITLLLSYGFTLTNPSIGVDDEAVERYFNEGGLISQNRFGENVVKLVFDSHTVLPFWREFIALVLICIGITVWAFLFSKVSDGKFGEREMTVFACVTVSFSFISTLFIFMFASTGFGFTLIFSALSFWAFLEHVVYGRSIWNLVLSTIFLAFGLSFFETTILFFIQGACFAVLLLLMYKQESNKFDLKTCFFMGIKLLVVMIVAIGCWRLLALIVQNITGVGASGYTSGYVQYTSSNLLNTIITFGKQFVFVVGSAVKNGDIAWTLFIALIPIFLVYVSWYAAENKKLLVFFAALLCVFTPFSLYILTGNAFLPKRAVISLCTFMGFIVAFLFMQLYYINIKKINIAAISCILVGLIVLNQSREMNKVFFTDYLRYERDLNQISLMVHDMEQVSGSPIEKPVQFIGIPEHYNLPKGDVEGYSIFWWDRAYSWEGEIGGRRIINFANMHGYNLSGATLIEEELNNLTQQEKKLAIWPEKGSIVDNGNYIVIKIGNSLLENREKTS